MYTEVFNTNYHIYVGKNQQIKLGIYDKEAIIRTASLVKDNSKQGINNLQKLSVNYLPIKNVKRREIQGQVIVTKTPKTVVI